MSILQPTRRLALVAGTALAAASAANVAVVAATSDQSPFGIAAKAVADDDMCTKEELASLEFEPVPECCIGSDGQRPGSADFRKAIEDNIRLVTIGTRMAFAALGMSKAELIEGMGNLMDDDDEAALSLAQTFSDAHDLARELVKIIRAAEIRTLCALANCCAVRE